LGQVRIIGLAIKRVRALSIKGSEALIRRIQGL